MKKVLLPIVSLFLALMLIVSAIAEPVELVIESAEEELEILDKEFVNDIVMVDNFFANDDTYVDSYLYEDNTKQTSSTGHLNNVFSQNNSNDKTAPIIKSISILEQGQTLSQGDVLHFTVEIEEESDISTCQIQFLCTNSNTRINTKSSFSHNDSGIYTYEYIIPDTMGNGKWTLLSTFIGDKYNNYGGDVIEDKSTIFFFVSGNSNDKTAPIIKSISILEQGQTLSQGDVLHLTVEIEEDSDISTCQIQFLCTDSNTRINTMSSFSHNDSGIYTYEYIIPDTMGNGKWTLLSTFIGDKYNNYGGDVIEDKSTIFFYIKQSTQSYFDYTPEPVATTTPTAIPTPTATPELTATSVPPVTPVITAMPTVTPVPTTTPTTESTYIAPTSTPKPTATPKISLSKCKIKVKDQTYTGKALKPTVTVKNGKQTLKKGTDFTIVSYKNNKAIGTAVVTIKGKGKYTGTTKATFKINPRKISISKLTASKNQLTVQWKKQLGITGYQVEYSLKKDFKNSKTVTIKKATTTSTTLKGLSVGDKYFVRIRTYKVVKKKDYYSKWSRAKTTIVKK